jgi:hypothetical protein
MGISYCGTAEEMAMNKERRAKRRVFSIFMACEAERRRNTYTRRQL